MDDLRNIVENPLLRETHERQRAELKLRFPELITCPHEHFLFLRKYILSSPHRFYSESVYSEFIIWLYDRDKKERKNLQNYLSDQATDVNRAFLYLEEINSHDWHDFFEKLDEYELIRFIDQEIHPSYLRLVEAVFFPILHIVAHFSRLDRGKGTDGLDIWNTIEEIKNTNLLYSTKPYRHIVRNGIAHGGITYLQKEITYRDKKGNEETYGDSDVIRNFDDLLDTCNGMALALTIFLFSHIQYGYDLPQQLLLAELREETNAPWWNIVGCTPSMFTSLNQLIIYARPKTSDYGKVQISCFQTGILAELFAPGYDRYFLSIRSESSLPGWAAFDGKKLQQLRINKNSRIEDYKGVIEDDLIYFVPKRKVPKILSRYETYKYSFQIIWKNAFADFRKQFGLETISVRNAKIHRNSWGCVLNGSVVLGASGKVIDKRLVRNSCRRIIRKSLSQARGETSRIHIIRYLPIGFARIAVFQKDYRRRRLNGFGLKKDLICTIQLQRLKRIKSPDILGSTIEIKGKYRIAWNKVWLEEINSQQRHVH